MSNTEITHHHERAHVVCTNCSILSKNIPVSGTRSCPVCGIRWDIWRCLKILYRFRTEDSESVQLGFKVK